ncbi:hypothetical protein A2433_01120 [Candidatus Giovannonibacteria bacterium RIFOXYC1_FULL_48_8]|nr:MAG: hypothetical protein A2433_01120 [Candidatus Giovannonibacteria bacterium RIFOXYC1_FULL_48_8]
MSWASQRRFFILLIVGAIAAAFCVVVLIPTLYKTPSCTDGIQNQDEAGIDCGGSCAYLCTAEVQPPIVLFTKVLQNAEGRTDVIALVENKNADVAAKDVPYRIALYGEGHSFVQEINGTVDLPPRTTKPIYLPGVVSGGKPIVQAFLEISPSAPQWFTLTADPRIVPKVSHTTFVGTESNPRVEAVLTNSSGVPLTNVQAIVLVYDTNKNVIAASGTVLPVISAQGQSTATFTWNIAFAGIPASAEVVPIIPLP